MEFTCKEKYGEKPISAWLSDRIKKYVKEQYGLEIKISVSNKSVTPDK